jgi:hypothetical protein
MPKPNPIIILVCYWLTFIIHPNRQEKSNLLISADDRKSSGWKPLSVAICTKNYISYLMREEFANF